MASLATIFRQVEREGRPYGLFPIYKDGKVKVCERAAQLPQRKDAPKIVEYAPAVVASLDETSALDAWSAVLMKRLSQFSGSMFSRALKAKADERAREQKAVDDNRKAFRAWLKRSANRLITVDGHNPDGSLSRPLWTPR